jgi:DNA-binding transcriptional MerR regulator
MSIGQVLARLRAEFPDVSISKIRFLEAEGLVQPERAPSGYRKFTTTDLERLQYILAAQRDHYLPLKVIGEHLEAMERGLVPAAVAGGRPEPPESAHDVALTADLAAPTGPESEVRLSIDELAASSGLGRDRLDELVGFAMVTPRDGGEYFDADALVVATTVARLGEYGLEPRHLRAFKSAADREVGVIEQVVRPLARQRDPESVAGTAATVTDLTVLAVRLHAALIRSGIRGSG